MYAVIESGGKQQRVALGQTLRLEKLDVEPGTKVTFDEVLLVSNGEEAKMGQPFVKGAKVVAEVVANGRGDKIEIIKFKRRKHHMKRMGHRQDYTQVKVIAIECAGVKALEVKPVAKAEAAKKPAAKKVAPAAKAETAKKPVAKKAAPAVKAETAKKPAAKKAAPATEAETIKNPAAKKPAEKKTDDK